MDREINFLIKLHPRLRGNLYRNRASGCLEYKGPKRGLMDGNPILFAKVQEKSRNILLRRWVWMFHQGPLPRNRFVIMRCGNHACHDIDHMGLSGTHYRYRKIFIATNYDYAK
jgi:hypothetical protein